jgi:hypothetical protein
MEALDYRSPGVSRLGARGRLDLTLQAREKRRRDQIGVAHEDDVAVLQRHRRGIAGQAQLTEADRNFYPRFRKLSVRVGALCQPGQPNPTNKLDSTYLIGPPEHRDFYRRPERTHTLPNGFT